MANQLQRQIQEEIDRESMTEKRINNGLKRVLKVFKQYKLVNSVDQGDIVLVYNKIDTEYFNVIYIDDEVKTNIKNTTDPNQVLFFIKHKSNRNSKQQVLSDLSKRRFIKQK